MRIVRAVAAVLAGAAVLALMARLLLDPPSAAKDGTEAGPAYGAVEMDVLFRPDPDSPREPLVATAISHLYGESLEVAYGPGDTVVFEHRTGTGAPQTSPVFHFTPGRVHRLHYEAGSLYPAPGDPLFAGRSPVEVESCKRWVRLTVDGTILLDAPTAEATAPGGIVAFGLDRRAGRDGHFSGFIRHVRRLPLPPPLSQGLGPGDVWLVVNPARGEPVGSMQPLLSAGAGGPALGLGLATRADSRFSLVLTRAGAAPLESAPFSLPGAARFRIRLGAMLDLPAASPLGILRETLAVWLDDRPIWWARVPRDEGEPVLPGALFRGVGETARPFSGRLAEWRSLPTPAPWRPGPFERVTLLVGGRGVGSEPLVATGVAGRADTLAIEWRPGGRARLICDHWSVGAVTSGEFDWPDGEAHAIAVELPAFRELDREVGSVARGPLRVLVDGRVVWDVAVDYYRVASASLAFGQNPAGSSVAAPRLTAIILEVSQ